MNSFLKLRPAVSTPLRQSSVNNITTRKMHIKPIKMSWGKGDNFAYLVTDENTKDAVIIDPAYPSDVLPVLTPILKNGDARLTAIMNTHHHGDHAGGNTTLMSQFKASNGEKLPVIAGKDSEAVTQTIPHGQSFSFGSISVKALHTPCHTQDSICWHFTDSSLATDTPSDSSSQRTNSAVFTGDTLFSGGCGRFFEGTAKEMDVALNRVLRALPDDTRIYPGHEYTNSNAKFAVSVSSKPEVKKLLDYSTANEVTTGRWTMGEEEKHNVFMMLGDAEIQQKTGEKSAEEVMAKLREMKNNFRG